MCGGIIASQRCGAKCIDTLKSFNWLTNAALGICVPNSCQSVITSDDVTKLTPIQYPILASSKPWFVQHVCNSYSTILICDKWPQNCINIHTMHFKHSLNRFKLSTDTSVFEKKTNVACFIYLYQQSVILNSDKQSVCWSIQLDKEAG